MKDYSKSKDFSNYLIYIFNDNSLKAEIRQIAGLTLKGMIDKSNFQFSDESICYFKSNIFKNYTDNLKNLRNTVGIIVNTFVKQGGLEIWPGILELLYNYLANEESQILAMETINIIIEDSMGQLNDKYNKVLFFTYLF